MIPKQSRFISTFIAILLLFCSGISVQAQQVNLPFTEDWDFGNFEVNEWEHECTDNWIVDLENGSPAPSAMFSGSNALQDYDCDLTTVVLLGTEIDDGDIRLAFNLKLEDISSDSTEFFNVYVDYTDSARLIKSIANQGSSGWQAYDIKITEYAKGYDFRITFKASGENTSNIDAWFLDNIRVYQDCLPPSNPKFHWFEGNPQITLKWYPPGIHYQGWLGYNDGTFENALASIAGGMGVAQQFFPEVTNSSCYLTKVKYFVGDFENYSGEEEIYILTEEGDSVLAGPYFHSGAEPDSWVEIDIDTLEFTEGGFMVATFNVNPGGPYVGVDDSYYNGTLFFGGIGNMTELSEMGPYYYVGSHMAYIYYPESNNGKQRALLGYNVFKQVDNQGFDKLNTGLLNECIYTDTIDFSFINEYFVQAVYDQCEANSDTIFPIIYLQNNEHMIDACVDIFPNPVSRHFTIESTEKIEGIRILSLQAELIRSIENINQNTFEADVSGLPNGLYVVSVRTSSGITNQKIIIHK